MLCLCFDSAMKEKYTFYVVDKIMIHDLDF